MLLVSQASFQAPFLASRRVTSFDVSSEVALLSSCSRWPPSRPLRFPSRLLLTTCNWSKVALWHSGYTSLQNTDFKTSKSSSTHQQKQLYLNLFYAPRVTSDVVTWLQLEADLWKRSFKTKHIGNCCCWTSAPKPSTPEETATQRCSPLPAGNGNGMD